MDNDQLWPHLWEGSCWNPELRLIEKVVLIYKVKQRETKSTRDRYARQHLGHFQHIISFFLSVFSMNHQGGGVMGKGKKNCLSGEMGPSLKVMGKGEMLSALQ